MTYPIAMCMCHCVLLFLAGVIQPIRPASRVYALQKVSRNADVRLLVEDDLASSKRSLEIVGQEFIIPRDQAAFWKSSVKNLTQQKNPAIRLAESVLWHRPDGSARSGTHGVSTDGIKHQPVSSSRTRPRRCQQPAADDETSACARTRRWWKTERKHGGGKHQQRHAGNLTVADSLAATLPGT